MKKNIFNNLYNEIIVFFLVSSITLTLIVWILQAVNFLDIISDDGHSIATYFLYSSLNFPKIFNKLLLLSYFLSIFYILSLYEDKNQLIIYWINGVGKTKFLNKIISFSIFFILPFHLYSQNPETLLTLAEKQMSDKELIIAEETLKKALKIDPSFAPAFQALSKLSL
mgnify:CR=1 FL=1